MKEDKRANIYKQSTALKTNDWAARTPVPAPVLAPVVFLSNNTDQVNTLINTNNK
jgi:hypothetical protein